MDPVQEWARAQQRVIDLVTTMPAGRAEEHVPACPDWTVRDLLSHMVGLGADVLAGDEPDDHNEGWTARQIERRRDHDVAALVDEWRGIAEPLQQWMRDNDPRPIGDVIIHEQDLRGAVGVSGGQDCGGMVLIRDRFTGTFGDAVADEAPIALLGDGWEWASAGSPADAPVALRASTFDLTRALVTRRSAAQLRAWTVRGDVGPYLDAFAALGPLPRVDLSE